MLFKCFTVVPIPEDCAGDSSDVAAIAGSVCGAVGFLVVVIIVIVVIWKRRCAYIRLTDKFIYMCVDVRACVRACVCVCV